MSDFDKEAEREKLREKFERDREKRKHTQQMSELLLKGATMTNRHCEECGDPIFRQNGQEFCPSCGTGGEAESADATKSAGSTSGGPSADAGEGTADSHPEPTGDSHPEPTADSHSEGSVEDADEVVSSTEQPVARGTSDADVPTPARTDREPATPEPPARQESAEQTGSRRGVAMGGDLSAARNALISSVEKFARAAAATDDPRRAKEHLEAAHEAAAALRTLED